MSMKDQVYELFSQGKMPDDPAVKRVGLTKESLRKYYRLWGKLQETVPTPVVEVPTPVVAEAPSLVQLDSLPTATLFEMNGGRYRIGEKTPECVVCYRLRFFDTGPWEIDKMWQVDQTVSLATFTMVKPIKK